MKTEFPRVDIGRERPSKNRLPPNRRIAIGIPELAPGSLHACRGHEDPSDEVSQNRGTEDEALERCARPDQKKVHDARQSIAEDLPAPPGTEHGRRAADGWRATGEARLAAARPRDEQSRYVKRPCATRKPLMPLAHKPAHLRQNPPPPRSPVRGQTPGRAPTIRSAASRSCSPPPPPRRLDCGKSGLFCQLLSDDFTLPNRKHFSHRWTAFPLASVT